jgi:hypothetical protein
VSFVLKMKDLAYWDTMGKAWTLLKGSFTICVGGRNRDIRLDGDDCGVLNEDEIQNVSVYITRQSANCKIGLVRGANKGMH